MKVYKVELLIINHDELQQDEVIEVIQQQKYPNYCINPTVLKIKEYDVGDWDDDHPLNNRSTDAEEYLKGLKNET